MHMNRGRIIRLVLVGIVLALIIAATIIFRFFARNVNVAGFTGDGGEAIVDVPDGFSVNVYAEGLNVPRFMEFGPDGRLYVAERSGDRIIALEDIDGDGVADEQVTVADDVPRPHSVMPHEGAWYVGITSGVIRFEDTTGDGLWDSRETVIDDYPGGGHVTRTVIFLPDGRMAVSVGSSCNVCDEDDERRATVVIYDGPEGTGERVFARGLRNAVGLAIHPETGDLWATNNGRDLMGDDLPPETIYLVEDGAHYGWPFCHNANILDPDFGFPSACDDVDPPVVEMQAHSAPLGLVFYDGDSFPAAYQGDLFVAFHGSWNRSIPTGYKIVRLDFDGTTPGDTVEDFATGWLDEDGSYAVSGRPVDVAVGPDGALYVSDDKAGFIYRIRYEG